MLEAFGIYIIERDSAALQQISIVKNIDQCAETETCAASADQCDILHGVQSSLIPYRTYAGGVLSLRQSGTFLFNRVRFSAHSAENRTQKIGTYHAAAGAKAPLRVPSG